MRERKTVIGERGDLNAPPGSEPWAIAVRGKLHTALQDMKGRSQDLEGWISLLRQHHGYRHLADDNGRPFKTYEAFCCGKYPYGLGYDPHDIDRIIGERRAREAQEMAADPEVKPAPANGEIGRGRNSRDNVTPNVERGNSAPYLVRRLKRDAPEVAEALARGEYTSARQAAIAAGIVKVPSALDVAKRAVAQLTPEEEGQLLRLLLERQERRAD